MKGEWNERYGNFGRVLFLLMFVSGMFPAGSVSADVFDEAALWLDAHDAGSVGAEVKAWRDHRGLPREAKSCLDVVPQDVPGLIAAIGRDRFLGRLKWGFDVSRPLRYCSLNRDHNEVPVEHGNQQSMHFGWLFNWAGEPRETQARVRSILESYYGYDDTTAWLGDEDQGQMSAWFVMSALGLFQTDGGASSRPHYELGSPLFEEIVIDLGHRYGRGGTFVIRAPNVSRERKYIRKAVLNGKPVEGFRIDAREILKGGVLDFEVEGIRSHEAVQVSGAATPIAD